MLSQRRCALGRREELIEKLPNGFDAYLDRLVRDHYSVLPEGMRMVFGRDVSYSAVREAGGINASGGGAGLLSGGQMQRLSV